MPPQFLAFLAALAALAAAPASVAGRHHSAPGRIAIAPRGAAAVGTLVRLSVNSPSRAGAQSLRGKPAGSGWYNKARV